MTHYTMHLCRTLFVTGILFIFSELHSQDFLSGSQISGNFQSDFQIYNEDTLIGAPEVPEKFLINAFANVNYTYKNVSAGVRYEAYQNALQGFDPRYNGSGIPYRFFRYNNAGFDVTVGNYYEQFGNGMIFRSYEEKSLGIDNAMDGVRLIVTPYNGIVIKGIVGQQRHYFDKGSGIIRGIDGEIALNQAFESLSDKKTWVTIGGSFISRFQRDRDPVYNLPENVGAAAARLNMGRGRVSLTSEYAYKINDPSATNNFIYKPGNALFVSATYSQRGLGVILSGKRIDNMDFRSERTATGNDLQINYLPALTRQHSYSFTAMYPYVTQANGEFCFQGEVTYNIKRETLLGGLYGTNVSVNYSRANAIHKEPLDASTHIQQSGTDGYKSNFFEIGDEKYFQDFNITVNRRLSRRLRSTFTYMNFAYNIDVIEGYQGYGTMYGNVGVAEFSYRLANRNSIKTEMQYLNTKKDQGDWAMLLLEYNLKSTWFFTVVDQYNFGNNDPDKRLHYYNFTVGYTKNANRVSVTYGKQRAGVICVGGVCRTVPASNGWAVSISSSF